MIIEKNKTTNAKKDIGYKIFYIIDIAILGCIAFFSNSYFAYDFFNSLFFDILSIVLIVLLLCVRSIQTFLRQTALYGKIFTLVYFNIFSLVFAVRPFVSVRTWTILLFFSLIVSVILLIILAFKYVEAPNKYFITKYETIVAGLALIALLLVASRQTYTGAQGMWIPIVIVGIILSVFSLSIFLKYFSDLDYFKNTKGEFLAAFFISILTCFCFSLAAVSTINYAFDDSSTQISVEVLDKRISSGARQATSFYFQIQIDDTEKELEVPVEVYHSTEVGDYVEIKLYNGALGYSYYIYEN